MRFFLPLTISILLAAMNSVSAQPGGNQAMTPEQAANQAKSRHGGRVLNVRPLPQGDAGAPGYRVKLLDKGEVRTVTVPPSGKGKKDKKGKKRARPDR